MQPEPASTPGEGAAGAPAHRAILIVEDNQVNVMILRTMLRKHGYEAFVASDGREGIRMTDQYRPRLVLMDLQMPRLDGFAAAREIRRNAKGAEPVLVAVTANACSEVRAACRDAGFAYVLAKPVVLDELISVVQRYVDA